MREQTVAELVLDSALPGLRNVEKKARKSLNLYYYPQAPK